MKILALFKQASSSEKSTSRHAVSWLRGAAILAFALAGTSAQAVVIANYNFTGSVLTSSDTDVNSAASAITPGLGLMGSGISASVGNPLPSFEFDKTGIGPAFDATDYIEFTVTAGSGFVLNLSGTAAFTFDTQSPTAGSSWALRSGLDTYGANIASGSVETTFANNAVNLSTSFDNLNSVTFRLYGWNGANNSDVFFDNITLNGVSAVPEAGTLWASLAVIGLAVAGKWRFGKRKRA